MTHDHRPSADALVAPLDDLQALLVPASIRTERHGLALLAHHGPWTTRVEVLPPEERGSESGAIRCVVRVVTELPEALLQVFQARRSETVAAFNAFAALGALHDDGGRMCIGSRLTIYEAEDAWTSLQLPLLLATTVGAAQAILGPMCRALLGETKPAGSGETASAWTEGDFAQVERYLSRLCLCTAGGLGLTAEFGLRAQAVSAAAGDHHTALFQLQGDQPHPEFGAGLFALLQMPHRARNAAQLHRVCERLNQMEMTPHDLPPHFGAWCPGRLGDNVAYVSFLPSTLHAARGIAVNLSLWALNRAQWASAMLASMGLRA
jgi:hypothetical protein